MPAEGMLWRHVICHAKNTWLHGDERGFRDRDHRAHSSGDYYNPPPKDEHQGRCEHNVCVCVCVCAAVGSTHCRRILIHGNIRRFPRYDSKR